MTGLIRTAGLRSLFLFLICFSLQAKAAEQQTPAPAQEGERPGQSGPTFHRMEGQFLSICSAETRLCKRVKMPKTLGRVEQVFPGPFLERVDASWIALSKFDAFLCALLPGSAKVMCARMSASKFPTEYADLRVMVSRQGGVRMAATGKTATVDKAGLATVSREFNLALRQATAVLQGEADGFGMRAFSFASTTNVCDSEPTDPGPPPHPDCELVDNMWACPIEGPAPDPLPWPLPDPDPWPYPDPDPDPPPGGC